MVHHRRKKPLRSLVSLFLAAGLGVSVVVGSAIISQGLRQKCDPIYLSKCMARTGDPVITDVRPNAGEYAERGKVVQLDGKNFGPGVQVWFGDKAAKTTVVNQVRLTAEVPPADRPKVVNISVARGGGPKQVFRYGYRYKGKVSVEDISPAAGPSSGGTTVTIKGEGFSDDARVDFGGGRSQAAKYIDSKTLQVQTTPHAPGPVVLNVMIGEAEITKDSAFTYQ